MMMSCNSLVVPIGLNTLLETWRGNWWRCDLHQRLISHRSHPWISVSETTLPRHPGCQLPPALLHQYRWSKPKPSFKPLASWEGAYTQTILEWMDGCGYDKRNSQRIIWTCCSFCCNQTRQWFEDRNKIHLGNFWIVWHAFGTAGMGQYHLWFFGKLAFWRFGFSSGAASAGAVAAQWASRYEGGAL